MKRIGVSAMFWKWEVMVGWDHAKGWTFQTDKNNAFLFGFGIGWQ